MGIGEAVRLLGITANMLQRSEREGRCGLRTYCRQLRAALGSNHAAGAPDQD